MKKLLLLYIVFVVGCNSHKEHVVSYNDGFLVLEKDGNRRGINIQAMDSVFYLHHHEDINYFRPVINRLMDGTVILDSTPGAWTTDSNHPLWWYYHITLRKPVDDRNIIRHYKEDSARMVDSIRKSLPKFYFKSN